MGAAILYTKTHKKVTKPKNKKVTKMLKKRSKNKRMALERLILYKKTCIWYIKTSFFFVTEKRSCTFAVEKKRKSMLRKFQIVLEPRHLSCDDWTEWFLRRERANVLGVIIQSYGSRFCTSDLEDVVQEASVIVWEKIKAIDEKERNRVGMKQFMIRTCRYLLSHEMRHMDDAERMDAWEDESRWEKVGEMLNRDDDMQRIHRQRYEKLMEVWDRLNEKDQRLLTFYYWDGKSMEEIAAELGLKNDKVAKNYKGRAMKQLKEMMRMRKCENVRM